MAQSTHRFRKAAWVFLALLPLAALSCSQSSDPFWTKKRVGVVENDPPTEPQTPPETPPATPPVDPPPETEKPADPPPNHGNLSKPGVKKFLDVGSNVNNAPNPPVVTDPPAAKEPTDPLLDDATEMSPDGGRYSIWVPSAYVGTENVQESEQALPGNLKIKISTATTDTGTCLSSFYDLPPGDYAQNNGEENIRNETVKGFTNSLSAQITRKEMVTLAGKTAQSIRFTGKSKGIVVYGRLMVLLDGNRLYQLAFLSKTASEPEQPRVDSFFKSFQIIKE